MVPVIALLLALAQQPPGLYIRDTFGRDVMTNGIALVDWEGQIANPAIAVTITPGPKLYLPARIQISANCPRIVFNLFSELGPDGCTKTIFLEDRNKPVTFYISILPDRDGKDEDYQLKMHLTDPNESNADYIAQVHVFDQDKERPNEFKINVDYSKDALGFFADPARRKIVEQAASDWAFFFADQGFDPVKPGTEKAYVWDDGFVKGHEITVGQGYQDFLLLAEGTTDKDKHSGCGASDQGGLQTRNGVATGLRRSATMSIETTGNWTGKGWIYLDPDQDWWKASNMSSVPADLASVVHHEMAHGLIFHTVHPAFQSHLTGRVFHDPAVEAYLGHAPSIIEVEHFADTVDPVSRVGVFGNEYGGDMPRKRWMITKFDLLVAQAVGYRLRPTSPFAKLEAHCPDNVVGKKDQSFSLRPAIFGGIPSYFVTVVGNMPPGLAVNSYTGEISGTPAATGSFPITLVVRDNDPAKPLVRVGLTLEMQ